MEDDLKLFATPEEELQFKKAFIIPPKEVKVQSRRSVRKASYRRACNLENKLEGLGKRGFQYMCLIEPEGPENGWFYISKNFPKMNALVLDTSKIDLESLNDLEKAGATMNVIDYIQSLALKPIIQKKRTLGETDKKKKKKSDGDTKAKKKKKKKDKKSESDEECEF